MEFNYARFIFYTFEPAMLYADIYSERMETDLEEKADFLFVQFTPQLWVCLRGAHDMGGNWRKGGWQLVHSFFPHSVFLHLGHLPKDSATL